MLRIVLFQLTVVVSLTLLNAVQALAQPGKALVRNGPNNSETNAKIQIKWYSQSLVYPGGVNIYRKQDGDQNWTKLNPTPILIERTVPQGMLVVDEDLDAFLEMAQNTNQTSANGFLLLNLFVKSFQSENLSKLIGIHWDDTKVIWGKTYQYKIMVIRGRNETELAISQKIQAGNYIPQAEVEDFTAALDSGRVKMMWKPEEDRFYGTNVYRNTAKDTTWVRLNKNPIVLSEAEGNSPESNAMFQDNTVEEGNTYYYQLAGLDFFGSETRRTATVSVVVPDLTPPLAPYNLSRVVRNQVATLTWELEESDDRAGVFVYRSSSSEGPFAKVTKELLPASQKIYQDSVSVGFYYYYVASVDAAGNESASNYILAEVQDTTPPRPPSHLMAKSDTGKVFLSWSRNTEPDLAGYFVFRKTGLDSLSDFLLVNSVPISDTLFTQLLPVNTINTFSFRVIAVDTSYNRSLPSVSVSAKLPDVTAPVQPFIREISQKGDSVFVRWLANPEPDLKSYMLQRISDVDTTIVEVAADSNFYWDLGLTNGTYRYSLTAIDGPGNESPTSVPYEFQMLTETAGTFEKIEARYSKRKKRMELEWSMKQSGDFEGFVVFRKGISDSWRPISGLQAAQVFEDKGIPAKEKLVYQVRAYSSNGDVILSPEVAVKSGK